MRKRERGGGGERGNINLIELWAFKLSDSDKNYYRKCEYDSTNIFSCSNVTTEQQNIFILK